MIGELKTGEAIVAAQSVVSRHIADLSLALLLLLVLLLSVSFFANTVKVNFVDLIPEIFLVPLARNGWQVCRLLHFLQIPTLLFLECYSNVELINLGEDRC